MNTIQALARSTVKMVEESTLQQLTEDIAIIEGDLPGLEKFVEAYGEYKLALYYAIAKIKIDGEFKI